MLAPLPGGARNPKAIGKDLDFFDAAAILRASLGGAAP
jgi:hypothetical protein